MMEDLNPNSTKTFSRRLLLKGSMKLAGAAVALPALAIGTVETAVPVVERAAANAAQWYEEVGGI